jgi:hypothetical protein
MRRLPPVWASVGTLLSVTFVAHGEARPLMSRDDKPEDAPGRSAAKEKLVTAAAAGWGEAAAQQMISRVQAAGTKDEVSALLNELARIIVIEARNQFGEDPVLAEVWRVAAHEAACAQLSAVEWHGP